MLKISKPEIMERGPYLVVGAYSTFEGEDEGPGWSGASTTFFARKDEITNRIGDLILGFLYHPHRDESNIPEEVRACFVGVEVTDLDHIPPGLSSTTFSGGQFVIVACQGDTEDEAAMGVGDGVQLLQKWVNDNGYKQGDACFACSHENVVRPPYIEYVYMNFVE
jgi:hypothetical protein